MTLQIENILRTGLDAFSSDGTLIFWAVYEGHPAFSSPFGVVGWIKSIAGEYEAFFTREAMVLWEAREFAKALSDERIGPHRMAEDDRPLLEFWVGHISKLQDRITFS